jgi:hypothetical protein
MVLYGTFGGKVPYVNTPNVGVAVAAKETAVVVAVGPTGSFVAVTGVVVRFACGSSVSVGSTGSAVAVNVSVTGAVVSVG